MVPTVALILTKVQLWTQRETMTNLTAIKHWPRTNLRTWLQVELVWKWHIKPYKNAIFRDTVVWYNYEWGPPFLALKTYAKYAIRRVFLWQSSCFTFLQQIINVQYQSNNQGKKHHLTNFTLFENYSKCGF